MTRRFFDVANLCPLTVDGQHDTHQATSSFLTAALDDEVLMREEEKKEGHSCPAKHCIRSRVPETFFLPDAKNKPLVHDVGELCISCDSFSCGI